VQAASLRVKPTGDVEQVVLHNDLPAQGVHGGIMVELGDMWSGEQRKVLLTLGVPAMPALGLAQVCELELRYVTLPDLFEHTVLLPVSVNVVPGDQAAGRVRDPRVVEERLFLHAQEAKRRAADAIDRADYDGARSSMTAAAAMPGMIDAERDVLLALREEIVAGDPRRAAKRSRMEHHHKSRKRGREL